MSAALAKLRLLWCVEHDRRACGDGYWQKRLPLRAEWRGRGLSKPVYRWRTRASRRDDSTLSLRQRQEFIAQAERRLRAGDPVAAIALDAYEYYAPALTPMSALSGVQYTAAYGKRRGWLQ